MNKKLALSIVFAAVVLVGCAATGPKLASSAEDIAGTWHSTVSSAEIQFNEDGTQRAQFGGNAPLIDEFRFEGRRLFMISLGSCAIEGYETGIYEVELLENGNLKFTVIEDECSLRVSYMAGRVIDVEWEPVP